MTYIRFSQAGLDDLTTCGTSGTASIRKKPFGRRLMYANYEQERTVGYGRTYLSQDKENTKENSCTTG